jgi:hypothetical protein
MKFPVEARYFSPLQNVPTGAEAHPASQSLTREVVSSRVKRLGREADKLPHLLEIVVYDVQRNKFTLKFT